MFLQPSPGIPAAPREPSPPGLLNADQALTAGPQFLCPAAQLGGGTHRFSDLRRKVGGVSESKP